jgi:hypothetical protein
MIDGVSLASAGKLIQRTRKQITDRRISVPDDFGRKEMTAEVTDRQKNPNTWLVHFKWRTRSYGSLTYGDYMPSRSTHASFLCGRSDKQDWAVRVPGTIKTVQKALVWITPAAVRKAQREQKKVLRQGDLFFIPLRIYDDDMNALWGTRHTSLRTPQGVVISHPQHPALTLPSINKTNYGWLAVQQKQLGNYGERVGAD